MECVRTVLDSRHQLESLSGITHLTPIPAPHLIGFVLMTFAVISAFRALPITVTVRNLPV